MAKTKISNKGNSGTKSNPNKSVKNNKSTSGNLGGGKKSSSDHGTSSTGARDRNKSS